MNNERDFEFKVNLQRRYVKMMIMMDGRDGIGRTFLKEDSIMEGELHGSKKNKPIIFMHN